MVCPLEPLEFAAKREENTFADHTSQLLWTNYSTNCYVYSLKIYSGPSRFGSKDRTSVCGLKGSKVPFWSRAHAWVAGSIPKGDMQEAADEWFSLPLSLPL